MRRRVLLVVALALVGVVVYGWVTTPWAPKIVVAEPASSGRRVVERGLFANYYPAETKGPAVLLLGGSEGGIGSNSSRAAVELQRAGFSVLTPSYFGAPGQPRELMLIPLETFDRALAWLRSRPEVDPARVAVAGASKGAEASLLVATRHPELAAVVAVSGSSYAWPGITYRGLGAKSSWTAGGKPLAVLPYGGNALLALRNVGRLYSKGLDEADHHRDAAIEIERVTGPVLLVCGEADTLWPACRMSRELEARAEREGGPDVEVLAYDGAGHKVSGPPVARGSDDYDRLDRWGGTDARNNAARTDSWPKVIAFLQKATGMAS
jgi:uncharacterized protein